MENKNQTIITYGMLVTLLVMSAVFAGFLGYGKGGFNISLFFTQWAGYGWTITASVIGLFMLYQLENKYLNEDDKLYGNYLFFNSPGEGPSLLTSSLKNPIKLLLISLIFFIPIGLIATFYGQTYLGVGSLEQQFTAADGILYNWLLVVVAENLTCILFVAWSIFGLRIAARKYNWGKKNFLFISSITVVVLFILFGLINHQLRYSASDSSIVNVIGFWALLGVVTLITGSFIPGFVAHGVNNSYVDIKPLFSSNASMIIYVVAVEVILIILFYILFLRRKR